MLTEGTVYERFVVPEKEDPKFKLASRIHYLLVQLGDLPNPPSSPVLSRRCLQLLYLFFFFFASSGLSSGHRFRDCPCFSRSCSDLCLYNAESALSAVTPRLRPAMPQRMVRELPSFAPFFFFP